MKIEIYGIDETDFRCGGCITAKDTLDQLGLEYTFIRVLSKDDDGFPKYDLDKIGELQTRGKFPTRSIQYPIIFINDEIVRLKNLKIKLDEYGIDVSDLF